MCLETNILDTTLDIATKDEYAGSVEIYIHTMKECLIWVSQNNPYKRIKVLMVPECIFDVVMCLHALTAQYGVSNKLSPRKIVPGKGNLKYDMQKFTPWTYHQLYVGTTNTQKSRSVGSIVLRPSNDRGGYYFIYLETVNIFMNIIGSMFCPYLIMQFKERRN